MGSKARRSPDRNRIDVTNAEDLRIWAMSMGVSEAALRRAIEAAGPRADKVREYLKRNP